MQFEKPEVIAALGKAPPLADYLPEGDPRHVIESLDPIGSNDDLVLYGQYYPYTQPLHREVWEALPTSSHGTTRDSPGVPGTALHRQHTGRADIIAENPRKSERRNIPPDSRKRPITLEKQDLQ